jgi:hypothetical protein
MARRGPLALATCALLCACPSTPPRSEQLARVAKDWCLTIRASQVIPVYPLSEDLQPGDVFLVRTRIEDEVREYESAGFLRMDNLVKRLLPSGYLDFYRARGNLGEVKMPPNEWLKAVADPPKAHQWEAAPRAAFPTYTFDIQRSGGFSLALPIKSVPVGLALLRADRATGSVQISDAYTYGIDMRALQEAVERWAFDNKPFLLQFAPGESGLPEHFLRVVNRVYLTGKVDVTLTDQRATGAGADAGAAQPVTLNKLAEDNTAENFQKMNEALAASMPDATKVGASVRVMAAAGRTIALAETFPRPLVIGYIAFDLPILANAELGSPASVQTKLKREAVAPSKPVPWGRDQNSERIAAWLGNDQAKITQAKGWLSAQGYGSYGLTAVVEGGSFAALRSRMVEHFQIP